MIILTNNTADLLIDILRERIFGDADSDKATHPVEANLLDLLIEKRKDPQAHEDNYNCEPLGDNFPCTGQLEIDYGE